MADQEAYGLCVGGNGKLMKALPLLVADQNQKEGQDVLPIKMLSLTGSDSTAQFIADREAGQGYKVAIEGFQDGAEVKREQTVDIVKGGFSFNPEQGSVQEQLAPVIDDITAGKVKYITSNTFKGFKDGYPPYLAEILKAGYDADAESVAKPIPVFPMELTKENNGDMLKANVLKIIESDPAYTDHKASGRDETFREWVEHTYFANSIPDRIVSDAPDGSPLAEPFAYIAMEKPRGDVVATITQPFGESKEIDQVDDLEIAHTRKTGILNTMHTSMVQKWILEGREPTTNVRQFMDSHTEWVESLRKELVSVVEKMLPGTDVETYSQSIMDRFMNPFNDHKLCDIAVDHSNKIDDRINLVVDWKNQHPTEMDGIETPTLDALMEQTVSARQLADAKSKALKIHDGGNVGTILDETILVRNDQPHKTGAPHTMEPASTKSDLNAGLSRLASRLTSALRSAQPGTDTQILDVYRDSTGITEGRSKTDN